MRVRWALGLIPLFLVFASPASALPMKRNLGRELQKAAEPKVHYPVARVAWDGPEVARKPFNPVYESMLYRISPQARRDELMRLAMPAPGVFASILGIIVLLRMMRRERERVAERKFGEVVVMPAPAASEAA